MQHVKTSAVDYYLDDNGEIHGEYKRWHTNGQLSVHCHYVHDKLHGEFKRWYDNGQLHIYCHYVDDKLHGEYKRWYTCGQPWELCHYVDGNRHGEYKAWYTNGQLGMHAYIINDEVIHNLLETPLSNEEKFELQLTHGGQWLCIM